MLKHAFFTYIPKRRNMRATLSKYDQIVIAQKIGAQDDQCPPLDALLYPRLFSTTSYKRMDWIFSIS